MGCLNLKQEDQLLSNFPSDAPSKVEIYTFASAANHFSPPSVAVHPEDSALSRNLDPDSQTQSSVDVSVRNVEAVSKKKGNGLGEGEPRSEAAGTESRQIGRSFVLGAIEHFATTKAHLGLIGTFYSSQIVKSTGDFGEYTGTDH